MASMVDRMIRAAKLDAQLYEEVEADKGALGQAMAVVVLASVAAGVGSGRLGGLSGILIGTVGALIAWFIWAALPISLERESFRSPPPEPMSVSCYARLGSPVLPASSESSVWFLDSQASSFSSQVYGC